MNIIDVVVRDDLYPRLHKDPATVQKYLDNLEVLPPIEVNQNNELIDGWHRLTAHKEAKQETIEATVTKTKSDVHVLMLAIERNAQFGLQLSQADKRSMAIKIYSMTP